jgi:hypothetical protein
MSDDLSKRLKPMWVHMVGVDEGWRRQCDFAINQVWKMSKFKISRPKHRPFGRIVSYFNFFVKIWFFRFCFRLVC